MQLSGDWEQVDKLYLTFRGTSYEGMISSEALSAITSTVSFHN